MTWLIVPLLAAGLILFPSDTADAARNGLTLCTNVVIPSLFPFFVLSSFVTNSGASRAISKLLTPIMTRIFRIGGAGASALVLGLLGGYPVGAASVKALYENRQCTKAEAEHLLGFCNNSGPSFILGAVGTGVFGSPKLGAMLLFVHVFSALCVGVLFRSCSPARTNRPLDPAPALPLSAALCQAIKSGLQSALNVCAFIVFFAVFTAILHLFSLLPFGGALGSFCTGLFEITSGIAALQTGVPDLKTAFVLAAVLLGFGGVSIHAQTLSFLTQTDLSLKRYFLGKALHALISAGIAWVIAQLFLQTQTVFAPIVPQTNLPGIAVSVIALLSFGVLLLFSEKSTGKER